MSEALSDVGVQWSDAPPLERPKFVPILPLTPITPLRVIALNDSWVGVDTHWIGGRTQPCRGRGNGCECADGQLATRWKGYLPVLIPGAGRVAMVELTVEGLRSCPELQQKQGTLRGCKITLTRRGKNKNSPQRIEIDGQARVDGLPACIDTRRQLLLIWGIGPAPLPTAAVDPAKGVA